GAREALKAGYVSGGTRRNLDWVAPHVDLSAIDEDEALLLADAQTSGGLLIAGEIPGAPVIGELVSRGEYTVVVRVGTHSKLPGVEPRRVGTQSTTRRAPSDPSADRTPSAVFEDPRVDRRGHSGALRPVQRLLR